MLGITDYSMYMVIALVVGVMIAFVLLAVYGGEAGPTGFAYKIFRALWYDLTYYFFGPRLGEV